MKKLIFIILSLLVLLASTPVFAGAGKNVMRFSVQFIDPTGELKNIDLNETLKVDNAVGLSFGFEHVFLDRYGIDLNLAFSKHDLKLTAEGLTEDVGDIKMLVPLTAGFNFHMLRNRFVDLYAGPFAGYVYYGDIESKDDESASITVKNDFAYGAIFGLDASITKRGLIFTSAVKYIKTQAQPDIPDLDKIDLDPWVVQAGLGFRF